MRIVNLEQRSPEWLAWRHSGIGSSDAAVIWFGKHFGKDVETLLAEKRVKITADKKTTARMKRGIKLEPVVRELYEQWSGYKAEPLCAVHDRYDWLLASMDGFIESVGAVVEIKCPHDQDHLQALEQQIPDKYLPQALHLALVTEARIVHYVSFSDQFPDHERFAIVPFTPLPADLKRLWELEKEFWDAVSPDSPGVI